MIYNKEKLLLIAGPCSLETEAICHAVAKTLSELRKKYSQLTIVFKGSFDKANRTSVKSHRGPGFEKGLQLLAEIKKHYSFPVLTDCHTEQQVPQVASICDILQIPAFLCRQTDLLVAAAQTGRTVNVKKGQFLSPQEMRFIIDKLQTTHATEIWQTERGTSFGYQNLIVDMRSFTILKTYNHPAIFDVTHSLQLPGAADGKSGGERHFAPSLAYAALAAGADGLFIETHPDPDQAISDASTQIPLAQLPSLIQRCLSIWKVARTYYAGQ
jgi:2-dehydro-3-deoxyphosphooctonate aldolase (KDO 8-P synthase)